MIQFSPWRRSIALKDFGKNYEVVPRLDVLVVRQIFSDYEMWIEGLTEKYQILIATARIYVQKKGLELFIRSILARFLYSKLQYQDVLFFL